jgi:uncharacterized protein (TIGR04141 family)
MTIFKAKETVKKFSEIFDLTTKTLKKFEFKSNDHLVEGVVKYSETGGVQKTQRDYPWMTMINGLSENIDLKFSSTNKTPSAVVGIKITHDSNKETLFFLLTFGMHTSRFINIDKLVNDFGIKVAMNICDPENLRKVNTMTHSSISTLTNRQASKGASLDIFDINDEKEFFRSISGTTHKNYDFIKSFSGRNSIQVKFNKEAFVNNDDLINILVKLDTAYKLVSYKKSFPTYGRLDFVSDIDQIKNLDNILFEKLKYNNLDSIHLSSSVIESDEHCFYSYVDIENASVKYDDLNIYELLKNHTKFNVKSSINTIKNWKIYSVSDIGIYSSMRAYDCINCETVIKGETFILNGGVWRSVSNDFKSDVENYIKSKVFNDHATYLPNNISIYCIEKDRYKEDIYNSHVAKNYNDVYLFDKSKINIADQKLYEICDLFHSDKKFIHVKVFKSGTSSLSHLFLQARFYIDAFIKEEKTRSSMRDFVTNNKNAENKNKNKQSFLSLIPQDRKNIHASSYSVVLCILTFDKNKNIDTLPFMVKYELAKTHQYLLEERGVELSYAIRLVKK